MKAHIRKRIAALLIGLLIFALVGCGGTTNSSNSTVLTPTPSSAPTPTPSSAPPASSSILGTWVWGNGDYAYVFSADGTGHYAVGGQTMPFTYVDNGNLVEIQYSSSSAPNEFHYYVRGIILSIEDSFGNYVEYIKTDNGIPLSPLSMMDISYSPAQTAAMSSFMNSDFYEICGDTVYGIAHDSDGTSHFVRFDLKREGDFVEAVNRQIIEHGVTPTFVTAHGNDIYYIRDFSELWMVSQKGGSPRRVISDAADYLQIVNDKLFYCDSDYRFCTADLDGSNIQVVLDKEIYYPYLLNEDWLLYQDDGDHESLHLCYLPLGTDVPLSDAPSYSPILSGTDLYFTVEQQSITTLAKLNLSSVEISYNSSTGKHSHSFSMETSGKTVSTTLAITAQGYCFNYTEQGLSLDRWKEIENKDDKTERYFPYTAEDYEIYWETDDDGYVVQIYVTLLETGGSQSIPRFD